MAAVRAKAATSSSAGVTTPKCSEQRQREGVAGQRPFGDQLHIVNQRRGKRGAIERARLIVGGVELEPTFQRRRQRAKAAVDDGVVETLGGAGFAGAARRRAPAVRRGEAEEAAQGRIP